MEYLQILADKWYNTVDSNGYKRRKHVTQFHDLIGFSLGPVFHIFAELLVAISLFGTGIAQIVASSSSQYTIDKRFNKLWALTRLLEIGNYALDWAGYVDFPGTWIEH